jgi:hypothetical protein
VDARVAALLSYSLAEEDLSALEMRDNGWSRFTAESRDGFDGTVTGEMERENDPRLLRQRFHVAFDYAERFPSYGNSLRVFDEDARSTFEGMQIFGIVL